MTTGGTEAGMSAATGEEQGPGHRGQTQVEYFRSVIENALREHAVSPVANDRPDESQLSTANEPFENPIQP